MKPWFAVIANIVAQTQLDKFLSGSQGLFEEK
jgi:hypothetical protein